MKIKGIIVKDEAANVFFAYVQQFPGICAQGNSIEEVRRKIDSYYKAFVAKMSSEEVELDESSIQTM